MKAMWQNYSAKFLAITAREQYMILLTGLVVIAFGLFSFVIEKNLLRVEQVGKQLSQTKSSLASTQTTIDILEQSLQQDPNLSTKQQIAQYQQKLAEVDNELLLLTTDLINPIQMRHALIELLKTQKNVALTSFEVLGAQTMALASSAPEPIKTEQVVKKKGDSEQSLTLYKHGIKITLAGNYFALRDYLQQLEQLDWTFFWQSFDYQITQYPKSELTIQMYSLSTKKEFIGV